MAPSAYRRARGREPGYKDKKLAARTYEISFGGYNRGESFAKEVITYRGAELAYENNYRYFLIHTLEGEVTKQKASGKAVGVDIKSKIELFKKKPKGVGAWDAYEYLNSTYIPGTEVILSIKKRKVAAAKLRGKSAGKGRK